MIVPIESVEISNLRAKAESGLKRTFCSCGIKYVKQFSDQLIFVPEVKAPMIMMSDVPVFYDCEATCIGGLPIEVGWAFRGALFTGSIPELTPTRREYEQ
jgi:hypothetical protein